MVPIIDNPAILALYPAPPQPAEETQAAALVDQVEYVRAPLGSGPSSSGAEVRTISEVVLPAVALPVDLAAAITAARADGAGMDAEIELDVRAIAGEVQHVLGRALVEQTRRLTISGFPGSIKLPIAAPLIEIEFVRFYDTAGELQTLDPQDYVARKGGTSAHLVPAAGRRWPDPAEREDAVEVQYRCGYGADYTAVPPEIQSYILGRISAKHAPDGNRNEKFLSGLLAGFKVYRL